MDDLKQMAEALEYALNADSHLPREDLILAALREAEKRGAVAALEEAEVLATFWDDYRKQYEKHGGGHVGPGSSWSRMTRACKAVRSRAQRLRDDLAKGGDRD